jgi:formylglycine-generating enzyme required for sulfatase activity
VISQPSSTVAINGSTTFTLRALDVNRGNHTATVTIASDAANVPSFNIPVASESNPKIECSWSGGAIASGQGTAVDFGATPSEVVITVASTGTAALNVASVSVSPAGDFQVISQPSSTVAVGGTTTFTLRALDANRGIHQATVTIANNDADRPYFTFPLASKSYLAVAGTAGATGSFSNSGTTIGWDLATTTLTNGSSGQAIKTGATPNSGDSKIGATFDGPGLLSWNWKVSAQQGFDWLLCEVNGTEVAGISTKTAAWQSQVVQIPAGSQVRWIYRKDATNSAGTDSGHLSDIRFSKFTVAQSSFADWSAAHGDLSPTQPIPASGMQAIFAWLGGVDPATGPSAGQFKPSVSGGFYKYRYTVAKAAAGIVQPQISTDLVTWNSRRMKQTLISEDNASAVVELSVPATGKVFSRFATEVPVPAGFVLVAAGFLPSSSEMGAQNVAAFYMAKTETTWGEWQTVRTWAVGHGYDLANVGAGNGYSFPVTDVNWYHVVKWCNARSEMEGLTPVYTVNGSTYRTGDSAPVVNANANGYRLPGEAEWEFAARGGVNTQGYTYSGSNDLNAVAWYWDNSGYASHSVATKQVNELGLSDMSGNVWEWCYDWYPGYEGSYRVFRGGSWGNDAYYCRVANRNAIYPSGANGYIGFRVARSSVPQ